MHKQKNTLPGTSIKLSRERLRVLQPEQLKDACGGTGTILPIQKPGH